MTQSNAQPSDSTAKETVLSFIQALNKEDFDAAREYVNEGLTFVGVLGSRTGADAYFTDMKRMKMKYDVKKSFVEGNDVCLLYEFTMEGVTIFGCGWYQLANGKIDSFKVVFDPRPLLENASKK